MASLIVQDSFEPYYAGRDDEAKRRAKPRQGSKEQRFREQPGRRPESEIVLPEEAPAPVAEIQRHRRPVAH